MSELASESSTQRPRSVDRAQRGSATSTWHRVDETPGEGRVRTAVVDGRSVALTRCGGRARRARQPLPAPGRPARRGLDRERAAALPVARLRLRPDHRAAARRASPTRPRRSRSRSARDGVYVAAARTYRRARARSSDVMVETMVALGRHARVRHGRPLQPRVRRRAAPRRGARRAHATSASATRARPRSRRRPTASSPAGPRPASRSPGPGSTNLLTGLYDAKVDRAPVLAISGQVPSKVLGRGAFQDLDLSARLRRRRGLHDDRARRLRPRRAR